MKKWRVQATPFAPGVVQGVIRHVLSELAPDSLLVVAQDQLDPFKLHTLMSKRPAGLVISNGAPFSHPMIRLLSLGVPVVIVSTQQAKALPAGADALLDGGNGIICAVDAGETIPRSMAPVSPRPGTPLLTADGEAVELRASVGDARGAANALHHGAASLGLVRSEFLLPADGGVPDADFYQAALRTICEAAHPLAVTVRLLDLAADKRPPWLQPIAGMMGTLGLQGARLYDIEPVRSAFLAEVEAIARLAPDFELSLLIPYVVLPEEFRHWRQEIENRLPVPMAVGSMAETPAAAFGIADLLAEADFVALGCNDLMQCLFAADRDLPQLRGLLDPYAPVLFRFLRQVAEAAREHISRVQVCGLLSQLPHILPVLLGLGYRAFSVDPYFIPFLARSVRQTDTQAAAAQATAICGARDAASVRLLLELPAVSTPAYGAR